MFDARMTNPAMGYAGPNDHIRRLSPLPMQEAQTESPAMSPRLPWAGDRARGGKNLLRDLFERLGRKFVDDPQREMIGGPTARPFGQGGFNAGAPDFVSGGPDPNINPFNPTPYSANLNSMLGRQPIF